MTIRISRSIHPVEGMNPELWGIVNGLTASAMALRLIADYTTQVLAKRMRNHAVWYSDGESGVDQGTVGFLIQTTPNCWGYEDPDDPATMFKSLLRARIIFRPIDGDAATYPDPRVEIVTESRTLRGTSSITTVARNTHRASTESPDNRHAVDVDLLAQSAMRSETYEIRIAWVERCEPIAIAIFEVPPRALSAEDGDILASHDNFFVGARVYDGPLAEFYRSMDMAYDRMGAVFFAWSAMYDSEQPVVSSPTFENPWDSSIVAWDANAFGFYTWPLLQGTLGSDDVDVLCWVILEPDWTGTTQVAAAMSFRTALGAFGYFECQNYGPDDDGRESVIIAFQTTIAGIGASSSAKVDVLLANLVGAGVKLLACGMYAKVPLDPRSITGLAVWLCAEQAGVADGATAATWPDISGNGNDAVQATGAARPTYDADALSLRGAMVFDGGDWMSIADDASFKSTHVTVFVVARVTGTATSMSLVGYPHAATHTTPFWRWGLEFASTDDITAYGNGYSETKTEDFSTKPLVRIYEILQEGATLFQDGAVIGSFLSTFTASITYPNAVGLRIGGDAVGGNGFVGEIYEILIYARTLTEPERLQVQEMLAEKYALQLGDR